MTSSPVLAAETYVELLRSGPHWLFELTLEVVSAPVVYVVGRAWRNGLLRHLHHDLAAVRGADQPPAAPSVHPGCIAVPPPAGAGPLARPVTGVGPSTAQPARPGHRVPVSWFSIPFGLGGLAGTWSYAAHLHLAPATVGTVLAALSAAVWVLLVSGYLHHLHGSQGLAHDLQDPTAGPFTALVLLTPTLLIVQGRALAPDVTRPAFDALTVLVLVLAGWLTGRWISGPLELDRLHPGYFLPSVAGGYLGSVGATSFGQPRLAAFLFGVGSVSWVLLGAIVLARLMFRPPLPDALVPTIAIQIAPPALATLAWLALNGGRPDAVASGLAGYGVLMVLAQVPVLPTYRRLRFSPSFWAFTFPVTSVATASLHWLAITGPAGGGAWGLLVLGAATLLVSLTGARTGLALGRGELWTPVTARPRKTDADRSVQVGSGRPRTRRAA